MSRTQFNLDLINYKSQYKSQIGKPFGGSSLKGNPKVKRPFSKKHCIHLILKSSRAKGRCSFLHVKNKKTIDALVRRLAKKCGVQIKDYVNVGNHLHILFKCSHRIYMIRFLKSVAGLIPRKILNCEKGSELGYSFWDARPFTKIIALGYRPFQVIRKYFDKNRTQALARVEGFDVYSAPLCFTPNST